jgi:hypothetical protein
MGGWEPSMMNKYQLGTANLSSDVLNWISSGTYQIQGVTMSENTKSVLPIMPQFYSPSEAVQVLNHRTDYTQPLYMITTLALVTLGTVNNLGVQFPNFLNPDLFTSSVSLTSANGVGMFTLQPIYLDQKAASQIAPSFASGAFVLSKLPYVLGNGFWDIRKLTTYITPYALAAKQLGMANTVSNWADLINRVSTDIRNDIYQYWTSTTTMPTGPAPAKTTKTASVKSKSQSAN